MMIEDARPGEDDGMDVDPVGMEESDDVVGNESRGSEDADEEAEEEAERQRPLRDPGQPTQEMTDLGARLALEERPRMIPVAS